MKNVVMTVSVTVGGTEQRIKSANMILLDGAVFELKDLAKKVCAREVNYMAIDEDEFGDFICIAADTINFVEISEVAPKEPNYICSICKTKTSLYWHHCCPEHTSPEDGDVVCDACRNALHA